MQTLDFKLLLTLLIFTFLIGCKPSSTKIYYLEDVTVDKRMEIDSVDLLSSKRIEHFVISNPPENDSILWSIVLFYNDSTLIFKKKHKYNKIFRYYYKETKYTPINYKEELRDYFHIDRIEHHSEDLLLRVEWRNGQPYECIFMNDGKIKYISKICLEKPCEWDNAQVSIE